MSKLEVYEATALEQVAHHSIYVWAASGQLCKNINEKWIREHEARNENGKHADEAVAAWKRVMASEYRDVARAFDCSGLVSFCLIKAGVLDKRKDCDGLYDRCDPIDQPEDGALLFRVNAKNPNDETHVGIYIDKKQIEARGREWGVVERAYEPEYWKKFGWYRGFQREDRPPDPEREPELQPETDTEPMQYYVKVIGGSVRVRNRDSVLGRTIGIVHNAAYKIKNEIGTEADRLPLIGPAPSGWYEVEYKGQTAYITNKPKYTEVVYE